MRVSGRSPDGKFVEIVELPGHPWYIAVQFHPEFRSKPLTPHPLFASFVEACWDEHRNGREADPSGGGPPWVETPHGSDPTLTRSYTETYTYDALGNRTWNNNNGQNFVVPPNP